MIPVTFDILSWDGSEPGTHEYWFRYHDIPDEDKYGYPTARVFIDKYRVAKHTPKGVWLWEPSYKLGGKFVLKDALRKFAHPTEEEALHAFTRRKIRQIKIVSRQLAQAESALKVAAKMIEDASKIVGEKE